MRKKLPMILLAAAALLFAACAKPSGSVSVPNQSAESNATVSVTASDEVVVIRDSVLEAIIREKIGKPEGDILASDMANLYSLNINCEDTPVTQLDGLEYAVNLYDFSYRYGELKSLSPIANCQTLFYLTVSYSTVDEATADFNTPALERVNFIDTNISDFTFLRNAAAMTSVSFVRCDITSIAFLANIEGLVDVDLSENNISDISPLSGKIQMTRVGLDKNEIADLDALASCIELNDINISYNHVTNLEPIMQLPALNQLTAYEDLDQKIIDRTQIQTLIDRGVTVDYHE